MVEQYRYYFRLFTFKFLIRALIVKVLRIYATEVKQLNIADELMARKISVQHLKEAKMKLSVSVQDVKLDVILRKNTSDLSVFNQVILRKAYQPLVDIVKRHFHDEIKVIVDVGGNIGLTSLYFKCYFPDAAIFVIEPSARNLEVLKQNLSCNAGNVEAFEKALLPSRGRVKIENSFRDKQDWSTHVVAAYSSSGIEAVSLTDFKRENRISSIDILKIDIEGHEAELFDSAEFLSELAFVKFLALEVHEERADRISVINKLQALGFSLTYKGETIFGYNQAQL